MNIFELIKENLENFKAKDILELKTQESQADSSVPADANLPEQVQIQPAFESNKKVLFDRMYVATASSTTQARAIAINLQKNLKEAGFCKVNLEGLENGQWIIIDCMFAVIHIMLPLIREYYKLEELWS